MDHILPLLRAFTSITSWDESIEKNCEVGLKALERVGKMAWSLKYYYYFHYFQDQRRGYFALYGFKQSSYLYIILLNTSGSHLEGLKRARSPRSWNCVLQPHVSSLHIFLLQSHKSAALGVPGWPHGACVVTLLLLCRIFVHLLGVAVVHITRPGGDCDLDEEWRNFLFYYLVFFLYWLFSPLFFFLSLHLSLSLCHTLSPSLLCHTFPSLNILLLCGPVSLLTLQPLSSSQNHLFYLYHIILLSVNISYSWIMFNILLSWLKIPVRNGVAGKGKEWLLKI